MIRLNRQVYSPNGNYYYNKKRSRYWKIVKA